MRATLPFFSWYLATISTPALAATAGTFADGGNTLVSAMMVSACLFFFHFTASELGWTRRCFWVMTRKFTSSTKPNQTLRKSTDMLLGALSGKSSRWLYLTLCSFYYRDIQTHQATAMDVRTNVFCSSGMHLPNGSYVTFGGNGAVGPGGNLGSQLNPGGYSASWDSTIQDFDGTKAIRVLNPCTNSDTFSATECQWFDDPTVLSMQKSRWYSAAEPTGEGNIVIIGGFVNGGYVNRNYPNVDPELEGGAAEPTYEYYPSTNATPQVFNFLVQTSGLNAYAHTFLMPSGKLLVQANTSTGMFLNNDLNPSINLLSQCCGTTQITSRQPFQICRVGLFASTLPLAQRPCYPSPRQIIILLQCYSAEDQTCPITPEETIRIHLSIHGSTLLPRIASV